MPRLTEEFLTDFLPWLLRVLTFVAVCLATF